MSGMNEFVSALAAAAEEKGLRIIIEPVASKMDSESKSKIQVQEPKSVPAVIKTPVVVDPEKERKKVLEDNSWLTVSEAARMLNVSLTSIYARMRAKAIRYKRAEGGMLMVHASILTNCKRGYIAGRHADTRIRCVETGKIYPTMKSVAKALECSVRSVRLALWSHDPLCGRHYERVT